MSKNVDLHIHTTYSDGKKNVRQILELAQKEKLAYISIADHDNIDAYSELNMLSARDYYDGKIINGVELKAVFYGTAIEVLGYNYDFEKLRNSKWASVERKLEIQNIALKEIKSIAKSMGLKFNEEIKIGETKFAHQTMFSELSSYNENEEILKKLGIYTHYDFYRKNACNHNSPFYFNQSKYNLTLEEAVNLIHECSGVAILAHPLGKYEVDYPKDLVKKIVDLNILDGLECMHKTIGKEESNFLINLCKKKGLLMTGGSDYHSDSTKFSYVNFDTEQIPLEFIRDFLNKIQ